MPVLTKPSPTPTFSFIQNLSIPHTSEVKDVVPQAPPLAMTTCRWGQSCAGTVQVTSVVSS